MTMPTYKQLGRLPEKGEWYAMPNGGVSRCVCGIEIANSEGISKLAQEWQACRPATFAEIKAAGGKALWCGDWVVVISSGNAYMVDTASADGFVCKAGTDNVLIRWEQLNLIRPAHSSEIPKVSVREVESDTPYGAGDENQVLNLKTRDSSPKPNLPSGLAAMPTFHDLGFQPAKGEVYVDDKGQILRSCGGGMSYTEHELRTMRPATYDIIEHVRGKLPRVGDAVMFWINKWMPAKLVEVGGRVLIVGANGVYGHLPEYGHVVRPMYAAEKTELAEGDSPSRPKPAPFKVNDWVTDIAGGSFLITSITRCDAIDSPNCNKFCHECIGRINGNCRFDDSTGVAHYDIRLATEDEIMAAQATMPQEVKCAKREGESPATELEREGESPSANISEPCFYPKAKCPCQITSVGGVVFCIVGVSHCEIAKHPKGNDKFDCSCKYCGSKNANLHSTLGYVCRPCADVYERPSVFVSGDGTTATLPKRKRWHLPWHVIGG